MPDQGPCGGEVAGPNPTDRGKLGVKRSTLVDAGGLPLGVVSAPANRNDSPLLAPALHLLKELGQVPESTCVHLDAGYDSHVTRICALNGDCRAPSHTRGCSHLSKPPNGSQLTIECSVVAFMS